MPGVDDLAFSSVDCGGGGGGGNGEEEDIGDGGGVGGSAATGIGIVAFFFRVWILSLYASFN